MSGHSKWHNIQVKKGKADSQRAKLFTKLTKEITVAVREGGGSDPSANPRLRAAIVKAKSLSVPKDNIDRAVSRGTGGSGEGELESIVYEAYGPGGVAFIATALTDNRNRTAATVRDLFKKKGGSIGASGSVMWMFDHVGVIRLKAEDVKDREAFELAVIEAGVEDLREDEDLIELVFPREAYGSVSKAVEMLGLEDLESSGLEYLPKETMVVTPEVEGQIRDLIEALEENEDVQTFYTNAV